MTSRVSRYEFYHNRFITIAITIYTVENCGILGPRFAIEWLNNQSPVSLDIFPITQIADFLNDAKAKNIISTETLNNILSVYPDIICLKNEVYTYTGFECYYSHNKFILPYNESRTFWGLEKEINTQQHVGTLQEELNILRQEPAKNTQFNIQTIDALINPEAHCFDSGYDFLTIAGLSLVCGIFIAGLYEVGNVILDNTPGQ